MRFKRNKFITFLFSLIPGASHMFMGFMKKGISIMAIFVAVCVVAGFFNTPLFAIVLPIIWFYSFFSSMNLRALDDDKFLTIEDDYIIDVEHLYKKNFKLSGNIRLYAGIGLLLFGSYVLFNNFVMEIVRVFDLFYRFQWVYQLIRNLPQLIVGGIIVAIGVRLIMGKKREVFNDE